jgi:leukotriene-A4 hydrolase
MVRDNAYNRKDNSTLSNPNEVLSTIIHLDWSLNFETKQITGSATHSVVVVVDGSEFVKFDSFNLYISGVEINNIPAEYKEGKSSPSLGTCIVVTIPESLRAVGAEFDVKFHYSTSPQASSVQWLSPKATSSGNYVRALSLPFSLFR